MCGETSVGRRWCSRGEGVAAVGWGGVDSGSPSSVVEGKLWRIVICSFCAVKRCYHAAVDIGVLSKEVRSAVRYVCTQPCMAEALSREVPVRLDSDVSLNRGSWICCRRGLDREPTTAKKEEALVVEKGRRRRATKLAQR